ncbi:MAG TPA: ABC transporter ATP-binding protein [Acidimicrobiales bacterium]|nr:ABC transporter ATP-binding protein [Acidimicrobiales bacterium]
MTKRFGPTRAVENLDLDVQRGEVFGFLGPNGAGKTTTIRMLLDLLRPTRGTAEVLGGAPGDPAVRRRLGFLPASLHVDPRYRGDDLFGFLTALRGGSRPPLLAALLDRFDLDPTRPVGELSTGNRRKVGIVQAFMHRPELVILDEPTSGLDPLLQHEFLELVREQVAGGMTVFLSSHDLPEVERVAHRVAILRRGELVAVDSVADLRRRARQRIDLFVSGEADAAAFAAVPGVVEVDARDGLVRLVVEGSVDAALKAAARLTVERVVTHEADLAEVFLEHYRDRGEERPG